MFQESELNDFQYCRGRFKARKSSASRKINYLFMEAFGEELSEHFLGRAREVFSLRNNLFHYKLSEMATIFEGPPLGDRSKHPKGPFVIDFQSEIKKTNPALVERITGTAAVESFNTALKIIKEWGKQKGIEGNVPGLEPIA